MKQILIAGGLFVVVLFSELNGQTKAAFPSASLVDSFAGFDEKKISVNLVNRNITGEEFVMTMSRIKREFINTTFFPVVRNKVGVNYRTDKTGKGLNRKNKAQSNEPCSNTGFENSLMGDYSGSANYLSVQGWTVESAINNGFTDACYNNTNTFTPGSAEFSIVSTPFAGDPNLGTIPHSPLGGVHVARLNDENGGFLITRISTSFSVTAFNSLFEFAYAGSWNGTKHNCCDQPFFTIKLYDSTGMIVNCATQTFIPGGNMCNLGTQGFTLNSRGSACTGWTIKTIDLTNYIGSMVTIRVTNGGCAGGGCHASMLFDAKCSSQPPPGFIKCTGDGNAEIQAPLGYSAYYWELPPQAVANASTLTRPVLNVEANLPYTTFTLHMTTSFGCPVTKTVGINIPQINISAVNSSSTCAGDSLGAVSVTCTGSNSGYSYSWTNSLSIPVGTTSLVTRLPHGTYELSVTAKDSLVCGIRTATVAVAVNSAGPSTSSIAFCNRAVVIGTIGTEHQWFLNSAAIPAASGGTASHLTINSPLHGSEYQLTFKATNGCRESISYRLHSTQKGAIKTEVNKLICDGAANGEAVISICSSTSAVAGQFTYTLAGQSSASLTLQKTSTGGTFALSNLLAGQSYTLFVTDGVCDYSTSVSPQIMKYDYKITAASPTVCSGIPAHATVIPAAPALQSDFTYSWTPALFINRSANTPTLSILPVIPAGSITSIMYSVTVVPLAADCPLTKTVVINVLSPPNPTLSAIAPMCNNSANTVIHAQPGGGLFRGHLGIQANVIIPSICPVGVNQFTYEVSTNGCKSATSGTFEVSQYVPALLTGTVPRLCGNDNPFNFNSVVSGSQNVVWDKHPGLSGGILDPGVLGTGVYTLTFHTNSIPNQSVCPDSKKISVSIFQPAKPRVFAAGPFCNKDGAVTLHASPANGTWTATKYINESGVFTPSLANVGLNKVVYSTGSAICPGIATSHFNVEQFIPTPVLKAIPDMCYNSPQVLLPAETSVNSYWKGIGVINGKFFPRISGPGNIQLTYIIQSTPSGACRDSATLAIRVFSIGTPVVVLPEVVCNNALPFKLTGNPPGGTFYLTGDEPGSEGIFFPALASEKNIIEYQIAEGPCKASTTAVINVEKFIPAIFEQYIPVQCRNNPKINLNAFVTNKSGKWTGTAVTGNHFDPVLANPGENNIIVYETRSVPTGACRDTSAMRVYVKEPEKINIEPEFSGKCSPVQVELATGLKGGKGHWNFGNGEESEELNTRFTYKSPGKFQITFHYTDELGCKAEAPTLTAQVFESPMADFILPETVSVMEPEVSAINITPELENFKHTWKLNNKNICDNIHADFILGNPGIQQITLISKSRDGCISETTRSIEVKDENYFYVPNAFSPNNDDDMNEVFKPVVSFPHRIKSFEMQIYDRWGHLVFTSRNITEGWNGRYGDGSGPVTNDVFVYKISLIDPAGKTHLQTGSVTVLQ